MAGGNGATEMIHNENWCPECGHESLIRVTESATACSRPECESHRQDESTTQTQRTKSILEIGTEVMVSNVRLFVYGCATDQFDPRFAVPGKITAYFWFAEDSKTPGHGYDIQVLPHTNSDGSANRGYMLRSYPAAAIISPRYDTDGR